MRAISPPPRARATYLAGVVRHTSTSSVGWMTAHVVHVAAAERGACRGLCARLSALGVGCGLEVGVCSDTSFTESSRVHHTGAAPPSGVGGRTPVVEGLAERGCHAQSPHNSCLKRIADRLSTASALPATYNAHSRRALDGHDCGLCGVCTSGQPLDTRLAHVHARRRHMLLARVCMDATHSEGSSLKVGCRRRHDV